MTHFSEPHMDLLLKAHNAEHGSASATIDDRQIDRELAAIDDLSRLLDTRWQIPGLGVRFGLDALVGLVPVIGDVTIGLVSAHIIFRAAQLGASRLLLARMAGNVAIDTVFGSVPLFGSVFDVFFKANRRNVRLLRRHLEKRRGY